MKADSEDQLSTDLESIADLLQVPETKKRKPDRRYLVNEVKQWLCEQDGWLLILDNVEEQVKINFLLSTGARGHVLLTTRSQNVADRAQNLLLEQMQLEVGALLLLRLIHRVASSASLETFPVAEREEAVALAQLLDGLPLALDQAGAYIRESGCSLTDYRQRYRRYRKIFLQWRSEHARAYTDYTELVATTWLISFRRVKQQSAAALELLHLCAYLYPDAIPSDIILKGAYDPGTELHRLAEDVFQFDRACGVLLNYALIQRNVVEGMLSIHRLVQAVLQDQMDNNTQHLWVKRTVRTLEGAWSSAPEQDTECYLPHAYACASLIKERELVGEEVARLLERTANAARERGWYTRATPLYLRAHGAFTDLLGADDPHVLRLLLDVAHVHEQQGLYPMAVLIYRNAYEACERVFGPNHLIVAACLNNLALAEMKQGSFQQAAETCGKSLAWLKREPRPDSVEVAMIYQVAAAVCQLAGRDDLAESYYQEALAVRLRLFGPEHPEVAQSLSDLGGFYAKDDEKLGQTEALYRQALETWEKVLGADHPHTAYCLFQLGMLSLIQDNPTLAESLCRQASRIFRQKLGPTHPITGQSLHCLACIFAEQMKYTEAEQYFLEAKEVYRRAGGTESTLYLELLNDYAALLRLMGREEEAQQYDQYIASIQKRLRKGQRVLSFEIPPFDQEGSSMPGHMWFVNRPDWTTPGDS